jgi:sugar/nucleoside kinase (ribokinase family)
MKIVLAGHVCIDLNSSEHASYTNWGSSLMYVAHYLRRESAAEVILIASYGSDFLPYTSEVTMLLPPSEEQTMLYKNDTTGPHRLWSCEPGGTAEPPEITAEITEQIAAADIICVGPLLPTYSAEYVKKLLAPRRAGSVAILSCQGYLREVTDDGQVRPRDFTQASDVLPLFDMAVLSEDDTPHALETAASWAAAAQSCHIIVTRGSGGASLVTATDRTDVPTHAVADTDIVDSVGCGDVFMAGAVIDYQQNKNIVDALKAGNNAAHAKLFYSISRV